MDGEARQTTGAGGIGLMFKSLRAMRYVRVARQLFDRSRTAASWHDLLVVLPQFAAAPARRRKALVNATGLAYRASGGRAIVPLPKRGGVPGQGASYLTNLSPNEEAEDA